MPSKNAVVGAAMFAASTLPAAADEWVFGFGGYDLLDKVNKEAFAVLVEYHSEPFWYGGRFDLSWMALVQFDKTLNIFAGGGVYGHGPIGNRPYFWESSLAVVSFWEGADSIKPAEDLLLHTSIGAGVTRKSGHRISISLDHLLDSSLKNHNPGTETIVVRYTTRF